MALIVADITQCRRQIASLSNSSSWLSLTTASVSTGSPTALTTQASEPVFTSTAVDKGKQIVIRGAGASGADLYTTISAVGSSTSATTADSAQTTVSNALAALGGDYDDDRHSLVEIDEAMFESDEEFVTAIIETPGHWARADFLVLSSIIPYGTQLPSHIGNVSRILIQNSSGDTFLPGEVADIKAIQRWNANTGTGNFTAYGLTSPTAANSPLAGYYAIDEDNYVYFTGYAAKARLYQYIRSLLALQSPFQYQGGVIARSMMKLTLKDGDDVQASAAWGKFGQDSLAAVRLGVMQTFAA
jgi:hypothetical protein